MSSPAGKPNPVTDFLSAVVHSNMWMKTNYKKQKATHGSAHCITKVLGKLKQKEPKFEASLNNNSQV